MSRSDFPLVLRRLSEIRLPLGCWFYFTELIAAFLLSELCAASRGVSTFWYTGELTMEICFTWSSSVSTAPDLKEPMCGFLCSPFIPSRIQVDTHMHTNTHCLTFLPWIPVSHWPGHDYSKDLSMTALLRVWSKYFDIMGHECCRLEGWRVSGVVAPSSGHALL